jgi:RNA polymerase sigma-70 factor (ECF subfamily)
MANDADIDLLISRTALGDRQAFVDLYDATAPQLMGIVSRIIPDTQVAQDVLYEVYLKIRRYSDRYAPNHMGPMMWLETIARNTAIDRRRALRSADALPDDGDKFILASRTADANAQAKSLQPSIIKAMWPLADDRRAAVRGAYLHGFSYEDLAEKLGVDTATMQGWLRGSLKTIVDGLSK